MKDDISLYLSGKKLYGDDFSIDDINKWFEDESEGYASLVSHEEKTYRYGYHELNKQHGFKYILDRRFDEVLGMGSAYGDELIPLIEHINKITVLDPSDAFSEITNILGRECIYRKPNPEGTMPFESNKFDLMTCFGVMHHIPNVSYVMGECYRCLNKEGVMLLREPIVSMGDWTKPRTGLTKRERGIPATILDDIVRQTGFVVKHRAFCVFPLLPKLAKKFGVACYNDYRFTLADKMLSKMFSRNITYHRTKLYEKFAPASVFYVLEKD